MSADGTVKVHDLWKRFRADRGRPVLRDEIERLRLRRAQAGSSRWRWVLRDITFDVRPGEAVGLFGVNGSGKSTLLKILTRIMYPYAGEVEVRGRVGALIEIKAGIHPDLTGRENIFLYGSLLGLSRRDVTRRFDEIVDFAELSDAVDRQVKFYSSGMGMRLGFGVAAFLEPHVLLVDEVLAVGDASFQQKCLTRMREVLANGTTLFFVSHDLPTIEAVCERGIWLHEGAVAVDAPLKQALDAYRGAIEHDAEEQTAGPNPLGFDLVAAERPGGPPARAVTGEPLVLRIGFTAPGPATVCVDLGVTQGPGAPIFTVSKVLAVTAGTFLADVVIERLPLPSGRYYVWGAAADVDGGADVPWRPLAPFDVDGPAPAPAIRGVTRLAPIHVDAAWTVPASMAAATAAPSRQT